MVEIAQHDAPDWVGWTSLALTGAAVVLAAAHTFGAAVRLGSRRDPPEVQSQLARGVLRDHLLCFPAIATVIVLQVALG